MRCSIIATVLNEGDSIRRLMDSLLAQSRRPDEIVIVDGGSRDNTAEIIRSYAGRLPVKVIVEPGANISRGRNVAISSASGEIIAVTDAGVRLTDDWFRELIAPFDAHPEINGVAGFFAPDWQNNFEAAMSATVLPQRQDINPDGFLPSSRSVAFTKSAWERVGGYPEWLDFCEDLVFDLRFKAQVGPFVFSPDALVYFRPRGSLRSFYKQYYLYARGDGKADLWRKRHAIRYVTYLIGLPGLLAAGALNHPLFWLLILAGGFAYVRRPLNRLGDLLSEKSRSERWRAALWIPAIRIVGDVAKMAGYPIGWRWRISHAPPAWR